MPLPAHGRPSFGPSPPASSRLLSPVTSPVSIHLLRSQLPRGLAIVAISLPHVAKVTNVKGRRTALHELRFSHDIFGALASPAHVHAGPTRLPLRRRCAPRPPGLRLSSKFMSAPIIIAIPLRSLSSVRVHYRNEPSYPRHEVPRSDSMWTRRPAHSSSEPASSHLNARRPNTPRQNPLFVTLRRPSTAFVASKGRLVASRVTNPRRVRCASP